MNLFNYLESTPSVTSSKLVLHVDNAANPSVYLVYTYGASEGTDINLEFNGQLRENQELVVKTYVDFVTKAGYGGGLLELPCAYGKTVLSLNIISRLKKKSFIIVHKELFNIIFFI